MYSNFILEIKPEVIVELAFDFIEETAEEEEADDGQSSQEEAVEEDTVVEDDAGIAEEAVQEETSNTATIELDTNQASTSTQVIESPPNPLADDPAFE